MPACHILRTDEPNQVTGDSDYIDRTNRAIDYVMRHLSGPVKLEDVARAARFSPFHFHRVFKAQLGETLNQFVRRQRIERALYLMSHAPKRSLTEIALECGFASSSDFSRGFKQRFGVPPSGFDLRVFRDSRRAEFEALMSSQTDGPRLSRLPAGENPDGFKVELRRIPARTVAYIRVLDPYQGTGVLDAYEKLLAWAEAHGLADGQWLGYMWEDPEIVAFKDCRYDAAVVVDDVVPEGEIGRFDFPAMRVAEVVLSGNIELELRALDWLFGTWLPQSGFEPDDNPAFEAWRGRPFAHGLEHFELSCQLPIK
ncbi:MAG: GyrI-like domain-containing protein [Phycisphaerales bacterium]